MIGWLAPSEPCSLGNSQSASPIRVKQGPVRGSGLENETSRENFTAKYSRQADGSQATRLLVEVKLVRASNPEAAVAQVNRSIGI